MTTTTKLFYAQSGGVTAVINTTACGVIETARKYSIPVYAGKNGLLGALHEELIDTTKESPQNIAGLRYTPGGAFGSCRYKLGNLQESRAEYTRLIEVFAAHKIGYFLYNGGGDSQDTVYKISQTSQLLGYPLICIGIPKTIDNDLPYTDVCPGFGSTAKYVATAVSEVGLDLSSMAATSTKVFILEVMGRHAGWIAAAAGLATHKTLPAPQLILFPEIPFVEKPFLAKVQSSIQRYGSCTIVVAEGVRTAEGKFLSATNYTDVFGHKQLGGVAPLIAQLIKERLGYKYHWAVADYLQRAARHIAAQTDIEQAYAIGKAAVEFALQGENNIMATILRNSTKPYSWSIGKIPLAQVANGEKRVPRNFITLDGFHITTKCRNYLTPLIQGEAYPKFKNGLPQYMRLKNSLVKRKLKDRFIL